MNTELKYILELTYDELYSIENSILIAILKLKEVKAMNEFKIHKNNLKYQQVDKNEELVNKNQIIEESILNISKELANLEKLSEGIRSIRENTKKNQ
ncbi:hypothetical protein [Clostridium cibarium]|uniref:Uncharacterized protein n=1 Tax=Clostridium cibarium TaxID=2762247 RepID=A0ABR8PZ83_9CLOT|nr:hypothetical protein [Clostridium cibarium]MBD7913480.1 hypothetical protein [Clostridium cibarium]